MKFKYVFVFTILLSLSCTTKKILQENETSAIRKFTKPDNIYSIDPNDDGIYDVIEVTKENEPQPIQGKEQFDKDFGKVVKYPAVAREEMIQGIVTLEVDVDINGKVTEILIKKSLSPECDFEAEKAFRFATQNGYVPFVYNKIRTAFRIEYNGSFWLEG